MTFIKGFCCENCGSTLASESGSKIVCFVCESEWKDLRESMKEGEDFPSVMEVLGKGVGDVDYLLANINTPPQVNENNIIDERYIDFISITSLCEELPHVDVKTLFALGRKLRNEKEKRRIAARLNDSRKNANLHRRKEVGNVKILKRA